MRYLCIAALLHLLLLALPASPHCHDAQVSAHDVPYTFVLSDHGVVLNHNAWHRGRNWLLSDRCLRQVLDPLPI